MTDESIPIVDLDGVDASGSPTAPKRIFAACRDVGFFYLENHGVPAETIDAARTAAAQFFARPAAEKERVAAVNHRGYIGMGTALMEGATKPDVKESFVAGREPEPDEAGLPLRGHNQWPAQPPSFRVAVEAYNRAIAKAAGRLLSHVAVSLGVAADFFESRFEWPVQRTNIIHYPPHAPADADEFGVAPHTDFGCITLLWQDDVGGLEVFHRPSSTWIAATPIDGTLVVNVGDLLERWSNGRFSSTLHRVVNRSGRERYSMATFFDPSFDSIADPRDLQPDADSDFEPVQAGEYILGRVQRAFAYRPS